jgi:hypothetical protein
LPQTTQVTVDFADIIGRAAQSPRGVLSLICLMIGLIAYAFFNAASDKIKLFVFTLLFAATVSFGVAVINEGEKAKHVEAAKPAPGGTIKVPTVIEPPFVSPARSTDQSSPLAGPPTKLPPKRKPPVVGENFPEPPIALDTPASNDYQDPQSAIDRFQVAEQYFQNRKFSEFETELINSCSENYDKACIRLGDEYFSGVFIKNKQSLSCFYYKKADNFVKLDRVRNRCA